jgi:ATP-binding cassette subfamily C (CFTR/MRP) protein 1
VIFAIKSSYEGSDPLTTAKTFSSLAIISLLTAPAFNFLLSLPMVGMSTGCLDRIQKFLLSESNGDSATVIGQQGIGDPIKLRILQKNSKESGGFAVVLNNAYIPPAPGSSPVLHHIDLQVEKETLTMIIGVVGAGKSTLLKAIIGELKCDQGTIHAESKYMAYCAQTAWLPNSTVRQIVCGYHDEQVEDEEWYQTVLHACAVDEDILLLPDRDDSVIGSRGVTLSGGQKQRLVGN